jgi:hypothetical protein
MSTIHFIGGEKGGVGKSVLSRLLSQYFLDKSLTYVGLDCDQSHATLTRYYKEFTRSINLDQYEETDQIIELALEEDQKVVIDLPAQSERFLDRWMEDSDVIELCAEMEIPVVYWYVVDDGRDSVQLLNKFLHKYKNMLNVVVVKNAGRGVDFSELEALPVLSGHDGNTKLLQVTLPALHGGSIRKIDKLNFSFWAAINVKSGDDQHLSLMERQRTKLWVKHTYEMFDKALGTIRA